MGLSHKQLSIPHQNFMSESFKICPICAAHNHRAAVVCSTCGASLAKIEPRTRHIQQDGNGGTHYDYRYGETDLQETTLNRVGQTYFTIIVTALIAFIMGAAAFALGSSFLNPTPAAPVVNTPLPRPTLNVPTVTLGPPTGTATFTPPPTFTPSVTPTPQPCIQTIVTGDSLIGAILRCGYSSNDILPTVMALNGITDANAIQAGQQVVVPWPTPTIDPNTVPTAAPTIEGTQNASAEDTNGFALDESIIAFAPTATPTLPAGVMFHQVQPDQNLAVIMYQHSVDLKVLSELNPEIDFSRCDLGSDFGGPSCIIPLSIGQMVRVPAPLPTPTFTPTIDPNATATPTATATFNEPGALSPPDRQFFSANQLITLRWLPTGILGAQEQYRVDVEDVTSGVMYTAFTRDIFFIVPSAWRGQTSLRHEYFWTVGVVDAANPETVLFPSTPRMFVWQGRLPDEESE